MDSYRHSQQLRERVHRHNRLMKMINNYSRTADENRKLEKIKSNTMMEINLRYLRSEHNRHYRFPLPPSDQEPDEDTTFDPLLAKKELIVYDLQSQNSLQTSKSTSKKALSLETSRRVVSLQLERDNWQRQRLLRLDLKAKPTIKPSISSKQLSKKNSFSEKMKSGVNRLKLPELKIEKYRENLKTQSRSPQQQPQIQSVISKKLITEGSESRKKMQGVQRYLQKIESRLVRPKVQCIKFN